MVEVVVDNRFVVAYNPWLTTKYDAHINVEFCSSIKAVKYLYKYIFKGHDRATVSFNQNKGEHENNGIREINEPAQYLDARYVGAMEASWRLNHFEMHGRLPAVKALAIHLKDQQKVNFEEGETDNAAQETKDTTLTAYFKKVQEDPKAADILYCNFPEHYTWADKERKWKSRHRDSKQIGRVYTIHPGQGDVYYLRTLLHHVTGATSFEAIRTVDGNECDTYKEACVRRNLLADDSEWERCMTDADILEFPDKLRRLFATILLFCEPSEPSVLFEAHKDDMAADYIRRAKDTNTNHVEDIALNSVLIDIERILHGHNKKLSDFGIQEPDLNLGHVVTGTVGNRNIYQEMVDAAVSSLTPDQRIVFEAIKLKIDSGEGGLLFLDAPGGTGKTFLFNLLLSYVRAKGDVAVGVASSGIAANLLIEGRTAHSTLKLPIPVSSDSVCNFGPLDPTGQIIKSAKVILWDEAPMMSRRNLEAFDRTAQDIMNNDQIFGGKLMLLGGDFRQILPVVRRGRRPDIVNECLSKSHLWAHCTHFHLTTNMRCQQAVRTGTIEESERLREYAAWLLKFGEGKIDIVEEKGPDVIQFPASIFLKENTSEALIQYVYGGLELPENHTNPDWLATRGILSPTNACIDDMNKQVLQILPGNSEVLKSVDNVTSEDETTLYPQDFLNSLNISGQPPHELQVKENTPVMLLRNIDTENGHCNGTRYLVRRMYRSNIIEAEILTGKYKGNTLMIPRIMMSPSDNEFPFILKRRQFPIRPAFCMTINKCQGQSLTRAGVYLPTSVFTHGQLYVAASRVGDPDNIRFVIKQKEYEDKADRIRHPRITNAKYTRNVVYKEVL